MATSSGQPQSKAPAQLPPSKASEEYANKDDERARKRRRLHQRQRRRRRAYLVLGDWKQAAKRADHLSRCPRPCQYCANPRKIRAGRRRAKLTQAELKVAESFKEQMREHFSPAPQS